MISDEETNIQKHFPLYKFQNEQKEEFNKLWKNINQLMGEKIKTQMEIIMRCCCFLTHCIFSKGDTHTSNQMDLFLQIENQNQNQNTLTLKQTSVGVNDILSINDFIKNIKKIVENFQDDPKMTLPSEILKDFSFANTIHSKCEEFVSIFFTNQSQYFQNIRRLVWSCYIYSRAIILDHSRNLLECLPMLIAIISLILIEIDNYKFNQDFMLQIEKEVKLTITEEVNKELYHQLLKLKKNQHIIDKIMNKSTGYHFELNKIEEYKKLCLNKLTQDPELKFLTKPTLQSSENNSNFSGLKINFNLDDEQYILKTIDSFKHLYQKSLSFRHFDERIFIMKKLNSTTDCSPIKMTPFKRQKITGDFGIKKPQAFKTLNFNNLGGSSENLGWNTNSNLNHMNLTGSGEGRMLMDIKELSKKINKGNFETMTPCSKVVAMDNWAKGYTKEWKFTNLIDENFISEIEANALVSYVKEKLEIINKKLFSFYKVRLVTSLDDIEKLILKIAHLLLKRDARKFKQEFVSKLLQNTKFLKSITILAVEIVLFIQNAEEICFYKLVDALELDIYDFWKIINPFLKYDPTAPSDILRHFQEIEVQLLSYMIWRKPSQNFKQEAEEFLKSTNTYFFDKDLREVEDIEFHNQSLFVYQDKALMSDIELISPCNTTENSSSSLDYLHTASNLKPYQTLTPIYLFLRRVLNYSIYLNKKICENLKLNREMAKEVEFIIKRIITDKKNFEVFYNKHVDQIIICTIIAVVKNRQVFDQKNIKTILEAYRKSKTEESESLIKSLFYNIKVQNIDHPIDILEFYETQFYKKIEVFLTECFNIFDEEEENYHQIRRRKLSAPESEIRKSQFESESAFENTGRVYESFKNTVFSQNQNFGSTPNMTRLSQTPANLSYSARFSPLISRSMYASPALGLTPRTNHLRDAYDSYSTITPTFASTNLERSSSNQFKKKLKSQISNSKNLIASPAIQIIQSPKTDIPNDGLSFSFNNSISNSIGTPEFLKVKSNKKEENEN